MGNKIRNGFMKDVLKKIVNMCEYGEKELKLKLQTPNAICHDIIEWNRCLNHLYGLRRCCKEHLDIAVVGVRPFDFGQIVFKLIHIVHNTECFEWEEVEDLSVVLLYQLMTLPGSWELFTTFLRDATRHAETRKS